MSVIVYKSLGSAFNDIWRQLNMKKSYIVVRGLETKEIINYNFTIKNHNMNTEKIYMEINEKYIQAEKKWYNQKTLNAKYISKYGTIWSKISNAWGNVNSNYGYHVYNLYNSGRNQFEFCIDELTNDLFSRKAIININALEHKYYNNPDMPCTVSIQYLIRNDKIDTIVTMRSNDLVYGMRNDIPWFVDLTKKLKKELEKRINKKLKLGDYHHNVGSMHIYKSYKKD